VGGNGKEGSVRGWEGTEEEDKAEQGPGVRGREMKRKEGRRRR